MTEEKILSLAREAAIEQMLRLTYNLVIQAAQISEDRVAAIESNLLDEMDQLTIGKADPAMSDHIAAEFQTALRQLLDGARRSRRPGQR